MIRLSDKIAQIEKKFQIQPSCLIKINKINVK